MKKRALIVIILVILLSLSFVILASCGKRGGNEPNDNSEYKNSYNINLTIDEGLTNINLEMTASIVNRSTDEWKEVLFNVYPEAFRRGARNKGYKGELKRYGGIDIQEVKVDGEKNSFSVTEGTTFMYVPLENGVLSGSKKEISISAKLTVPSGDNRFGLNRDILNLANFYPQLAVYENGAFRKDVFTTIGDPFYSEDALYNLEINAPEKLVIASSGNVIEVVKGGGKQKIKVEANNVRDVALAASYNFKTVEKSVGDTLVKYYYTGSQSPEGELQAAVSTLSSFNSILGNYPYKTFSVVETDLNAGGMEFPTLVYIARFEEDKKSIVIHETLHQWFGCLVGSDAINTSWLDEGLVSFLSDYYYSLSGDRKKFTELIDSTRREYDAFMKLQKANLKDYSANMQKSLYQFSGNYEYSMVIYVRGSLMFNDIYTYFGKDKFEKGLKQYVKDNKHKNASPNDFYKAFNKKSGDVERLISAWVYDKVAFASFS